MRLRRRADIELVRRGGEMRSDRLFTLRARPNGLDVVRVAVASPRALGGAVRRNRARRRVREALRTLLGERRAPRGMDLFVVTRPQALEAPSEAIRTAVARQLDAVLGTP
ncbi:MAG TPA: ribonuclease P protein component [Candidatus Limnocylindria bacterium]